VARTTRFGTCTMKRRVRFDGSSMQMAAASGMKAATARYAMDEVRQRFGHDEHIGCNGRVTRRTWYGKLRPANVNHDRTRANMDEYEKSQKHDSHRWPPFASSGREVWQEQSLPGQSSGTRSSIDSSASAFKLVRRALPPLGALGEG
jgi:hypothetical protein